MKNYSILVICLFFIGCNPNSDTDLTDAESSQLYTVDRVIDGDTFWTKNSKNVSFKVRLIGIDAPENSTFGDVVEEEFGNESTMFLTDVLEGKKVFLQSDVDSLDRYGRTLSYVYTSDTVFVNATMILEGWAQTMTIAPNVLFADYFAELQEQAREQKKGIWQ